MKLLNYKNVKITVEQAQKALETIKYFDGIDPAYISADLAVAYEALEIFIKQQKENL